MKMDYSVEYRKFQTVISHPKRNFLIPESGSEIFVKNLPQRVSKDELVNFFSKAGEIIKIRVMMEENGIDNRGYCYVSYRTATMAKNAVKNLSHMEFRKDIYLFIENSLNNCRIFMGGIPTHKTKDQVWQELDRHGIRNVVDIIMYRSYNDRAINRGFVFIEFKDHESAAHFRAKYTNSLKLWGQSVIIDWSVPIPEVDAKVLGVVKVIFLRNLSTTQTPEELSEFVLKFTNRKYVEKVYKFKNYAFIHLSTREHAEKLLTSLKNYYKDTSLEIEWAKPVSRYTTPEYRQHKVNSLAKSRSRTTSSSSSLEDEIIKGNPKKFSQSFESVKEREKWSTRFCRSGSYDPEEGSSSSSPNDSPPDFSVFYRDSPYGDIAQAGNPHNPHSNDTSIFYTESIIYSDSLVPSVNSTPHSTRTSSSHSSITSPISSPYCSIVTSPQSSTKASPDVTITSPGRSTLTLADYTITSPPPLTITSPRRLTKTSPPPTKPLCAPYRSPSPTASTCYNDFQTTPVSRCSTPNPSYFNMLDQGLDFTKPNSDLYRAYKESLIYPNTNSYYLQQYKDTMTRIYGTPDDILELNMKQLEDELKNVLLNDSPDCCFYNR